MSDCIFCKIANNEIPAAKIFEDKKVMAFLSIRPISPGHTIVILREHFPTFIDIPLKELKYLTASVQRLCKTVKKATKADGFILSMNNGRAAGQEIDHTHFHIIPRFKDDGLKSWPEGSYKEGEIEKWADKIKA